MLYFPTKTKRRFKKDPMESLSNLEKILQEFYGILISSGKDPTVLYTRSYKILKDPTVS